jgi:hypothetical protein
VIKNKSIDQSQNRLLPIYNHLGIRSLAVDLLINSRGLSMRMIAILSLVLMNVGAMASTSCKIGPYLKSQDGKERLNSLIERSKSLIISKLEDLGIEEDQVQIKTILPNSVNDSSKMDIQIKSKTLTAEGSKMSFAKAIRDEDCGLEISIDGGHLLNKESGKNFGSLGRVKEFVRVN